MSTTVTVAADGGMTLPAEVCRAAGLTPGAAVVAQVAGGRIVLARPAPTLAERIIARANALPKEVLDRMPTDGASQHDHYIYGTPKRPE